MNKNHLENILAMKARINRSEGLQYQIAVHEVQESMYNMGYAMALISLDEELIRLVFENEKQLEAYKLKK